MSLDYGRLLRGNVTILVWSIFFQTLDTFKSFLKIWVYFQAYKNLNLPKKWEKKKKKLKEKVSVQDKKKIGFETDTEIGP